MRATLCLLTALLLLTACATVTSESCPRLVAYSKAQMTRAADELDLLPEGSVIVEMIGDYAVVRSEIRVCKTGLNKGWF